MADPEVKDIGGVDWGGLAVVLGEEKLRQLREMLLDGSGTRTNVTIRTVGLNAAQWDMLIRSEIYGKYLSMKLGLSLEGIIKLDKSQIQTLKILLEWRKNLTAAKRLESTDEAIVVEAEG